MALNLSHLFLCLYNVKKILKIAVLLPLVVLYSLFSGNYKTNILPEVNVHTQSSNKLDFSAFSSAILQHPLSLSEKVVTGFNPFSFPTKNRLSTFWKFNKAIELILSRNSTTCRIFPKNIFDSFRPTDIIFPFHYFW